MVAMSRVNLSIFLQRSISFWRFPHFLLVRNPYQRAVSFYKDKFRHAPSVKLYKYDDLQVCQRLFFPYLQIGSQDSPIIIREKLLSLSFAQFITLLPNVYQQDVHLRPQVMTRQIYFRGKPAFPLKIDRILKVESTDTLHIMYDQLGLDLSRKYNSTSDVPFTDSWIPRLRTVVNELYQADFEEFGYEMHTKEWRLNKTVLSFLSETKNLTALFNSES